MTTDPGAPSHRDPKTGIVVGSSHEHVGDDSYDFAYPVELPFDARMAEFLQRANVTLDNPINDPLRLILT